MYKTIIRFDFCDIRNNQGLGKCYQPQLGNSYLDLDYSGYRKNLIQYNNFKLLGYKNEYFPKKTQY